MKKICSCYHSLVNNEIAWARQNGYLNGKNLHSSDPNSNFRCVGMGSFGSDPEANSKLSSSGSQLQLESLGPSLCRFENRQNIRWGMHRDAHNLHP